MNLPLMVKYKLEQKVVLVPYFIFDFLVNGVRLD